MRSSGPSRGACFSRSVPSRGSDLYLLNSPHGRAAAAGLERGEWTAGRIAPPLDDIGERPNIFTLYEQNIGPLTPIMAESLRDAEQDYSPDWVEEAIRAAVEHNARSWKYVQAAILEGWKKDGRAGEILRCRGRPQAVY